MLGVTAARRAAGSLVSMKTKPFANVARPLSFWTVTSTGPSSNGTAESVVAARSVSAVFPVLARLCPPRMRVLGATKPVPWIVIGVAPESGPANGVTSRTRTISYTENASLKVAAPLGFATVTS